MGEGAGFTQEDEPVMQLNQGKTGRVKSNGSTCSVTDGGGYADMR